MEVDGAICSKSTEKQEAAATTEATKTVENGDVSESEAAPVAEEPQAPEVIEATKEAAEESSSNNVSAAEETVVVPASVETPAEKEDKEVPVEIVVPELETVADDAVVAEESSSSAVVDSVAPTIPSDEEVVIVESTPKVEEKLSEKGKDITEIIVIFDLATFLSADAEPTIADSDAVVTNPQ